MKERDRFAGFAGVSSRLRDEQTKMIPASPEPPPDAAAEKKRAMQPEKPPPIGPMWHQTERRPPGDSFAGMPGGKVSQVEDRPPPRPKRTPLPGPKEG